MTAATMLAQPSSTYYQKINGKKCESLKSELNAIISSHTKLSYNSLWTSYAKTDYVVQSNGQKKVFDYYSDETFYFNDNGSDVSGMNKEHVAPQSWWGSGTTIAVGSDLFQVLPSEASANSSKSNYPLGKVTGTVSFQNSRMKTGRDAAGELVFEPCDEYKGDFARIYFYVATCYPSVEWRDVSGVKCAFAQEAYPTLKAEFQQLLLQWNEDDPVSEWEKTRQERVYGEQGNRNPFIDYPDLANYIWGELKDEAFDLLTAELYYITPIDYSNGGGNVTPQPGDDVELGDVLLAEDFSSCTKGDNTSTQGSSTAWTGNDNFATVEAAYQAGGAVKLGTGSKVGSLTTQAVTFAGGQLAVTVQVKGWTTVEGDLEISIVGTNEKQTLSYSATMGTDFETVQAVFEDAPANPQIMIATTGKRCFIDALTVSAVKEVEPETETTITLGGAMATYCSPLDLDFSDVEGLRAYVATGYTHGCITLTRVTNVPAGTGLVLVGDAGEFTVPVGDGQAVLMNMLVGTKTDITLNPTFGSKTNFILSNGSDGIGFYACSGGTLAAGKAYLQLPTSLVQTAGVKNFGLQFEDGEVLPTEVEELLMASHRSTDTGWFTLDGRRLQHQPQQPGIYVRGGRKVLVR